MQTHHIDDEDIKKESGFNPLTVTVAPTDKSGISQPAGVEAGVIPKNHCSYLFCGMTGSGKTNAVIFLLNSEHLLKGAFQKYYYFIGSLDDSLLKSVKIPKDNVIRNFDTKKLEEIRDSQKKIIKEKGIVEASKTNSMCIIFDDILMHKKFLKSSILMDLVTCCRHYLITCIFNTQSFKSIPRPIRLQMRGICLFPSSRNEVEVFADERCLPNMSKRRFIKLIEYCTSEPYQFAFINEGCSNPNEKLRKGFSTIIN